MMSNPIRDIFELTTSAAVDHIGPLRSGDKICVLSTAAAAIAFGDHSTTPSLTAAITATGTLTSTGVFGNNETVTIGTVVYTFKTALTGAAYEVLIGANQAASHLNLLSAINRAAGMGTLYSSATVAHPQVWGKTATGTTTVVNALRPGVLGNAIVTTETVANAAWGGAVLASGAGIPGQIQVPANFPLHFTVPNGSREVSNGIPVTDLAVFGAAGKLTVLVFG